MDRTKFFKIEEVDSVEEFDYLYNSLHNFEITYQPGYYRVVDEDIYRPDLISYKNYGTVNYWWLVIFINGVYDPFYDLAVGDLLTIPNILDIYEFYKKYRKR